MSTQADASEQEEAPLYKKRIPIYTRSVKGKFRTFKTSVLVLAYSVFFLLPWVPWERQSAADQAVMFDLVSRRFFIFDLVVYPQDVIWLSFLLFIAAAFLFFITGLVGRAWCGYFCFQTLWMDAFMLIEHYIQGERPARMRLAKQPWNAEKILKIGGSHVLMIALAFWTAFTFAAYFNYTPEFFKHFFLGESASVAYFSVLVLTISTYLAGGLAREQVCIYMCPYARFQSVMYEADTLAPSYEYKRGEGSAGRIAAKSGLRTREERQAKGHGDCIDCGFCVQVCPTGVDIRNGLQYQCVSCGLCIDACNNIMDSLGWPRGLIRYDSERNLESDKPKEPHLNFLRLKVIGYAAAIAVMIGALIFSVSTRSDYEVRVLQVRQPLFVELSDHKVRNRYEIHIVNKTEHAEQYRIEVEGIPQEAFSMGATANPLSVRAGKDLRVRAKVDLDEDDARRTHEFKYIIVPLSDPDSREVRTTSFNAPHDHEHDHERKHDD